MNISHTFSFSTSPSTSYTLLLQHFRGMYEGFLSQRLYEELGDKGIAGNLINIALVIRAGENDYPRFLSHGMRQRTEFIQKYEAIYDRHIDIQEYQIWNHLGYIPMTPEIVERTSSGVAHLNMLRKTHKLDNPLMDEVIRIVIVNE